VASSSTKPSGKEDGGVKGRRWTEEEDRLLKETVLEAIRLGGTQIEAFEKVGEKLNRTPGSCGFRWNAVVKQQDPHSFLEAKRARVAKQLRKNKEERCSSVDALIPMLKKLEQEEKSLKEHLNHLKDKRKKLDKRYRILKEENRGLREDRESYQWYQKEVKNKYRYLLNLLSDMGANPFFSATLPAEDHAAVQTEAEHKKETTS
jgi:prespore-specific regulator